MSLDCKFYPPDNVTLSQLNFGKTVLINCAKVRSGLSNDQYCDLREELNQDIESDHFDLVAFIHDGNRLLQKFKS